VITRTHNVFFVTDTSWRPARCPGMGTTALDLESTRLWADFVLHDRGDGSGEEPDPGLAVARAAALWRRWREHMTTEAPSGPPAPA